MKFSHCLKSSIAALTWSFSSLAAAQVSQFSTHLPQCGGFVDLQIQGTWLLFKLKEVSKCSSVSIGSKSIKMTKTFGTYSLAYEMPLMNRPAELLVHSNSKKTMDRIPLQDLPGKSHSGMATGTAPIYQTPAIGTERKVQLMDICQDSFDGSDNESRCMQIALHRGLDVSIVKACEESFDGDANELKCLDDAMGSDMVSSCEQAFDGDANELSCLQLAQSTDVIQACDESFDGDVNELECLRYASRGFADAPRIIRKCESQKSGDADELECIKMLIGS